MVRDILPQDYSKAAELLRQLGYESSLSDLALRIEALRQDKFSQILIVEEQNQIFGLIHFVLRRRLELEDCVEIAALVVDESVRGKGMGTTLVEAAENWARQIGVKTIRVRTNIKREKTHKFYEKCGYDLTKTSSLFVKRMR